MNNSNFTREFTTICSEVADFAYLANFINDTPALSMEGIIPVDSKEIAEQLRASRDNLTRKSMCEGLCAYLLENCPLVKAASYSEDTGFIFINGNPFEYESNGYFTDALRIILNEDHAVFLCTLFDAVMEFTGKLANYDDLFDKYLYA